MQGFIQGVSGDELAESFVPRDDIDATKAPTPVTPSRLEDAVDWINRIFPFAVIPWLNRDDHVQILEEHQDQFGQLISFGPAGYLLVFAADLV